MNKESTINGILDEILNLKVPSIQESRRADLSSFMSVVINGDEIKEYLVISAQIAREDGALVYLFSETRLLKFDITSKETSSSFKLEDISSINYTREKETRTINISMKDYKGFGLIYNKSDADKIETFFQKLDDLRAKKDGGK